jgi:hypothetical protein
MLPHGIRTLRMDWSASSQPSRLTIDFDRFSLKMPVQAEREE